MQFANDSNFFPTKMKEEKLELKPIKNLKLEKFVNKDLLIKNTDCPPENEMFGIPFTKIIKIRIK